MSSAKVLLFSVTFPTYALLLCSKVTGDELSTVDLGFSQGIVALVFIAFVADQQQWNYQSAKKEYKATGKVPAGYRKEDLDLGFNTTGLWAWSRHPNFAAEQSVWVGMYLWSCYITNTYYNWTGYGALSYLMLFQGSTWFTELVSSRKYPDYAEYQKHVGMFVPAFGGKWPSNYKGKNSVKSEIRKK
ncbi:MAG: hypothetical protein MMC33_001444 [Icmadophila ericetorum]|nr:hypothetical protein [Icmadophila ericetorum]